jgi:prepilin-type N-terminal cleavage/methylation domain-containing protein/prepilin-type processing-associated H-X9-DG protein
MLRQRKHDLRFTVPNPRAFSLIELLAVIAIMVILTTLFWGSDSQGEAAARKKACERNLQKLYVAMEIFATDNTGSFPKVADARTSDAPLNALVPRYTSETALFICPGAKGLGLANGGPILGKRTSYAYYMGRTQADATEPLLSDAQINTQPKAAGQPAFSSTGKPPGNNHGKTGGNIVFCDGRVVPSPVQVPFALGLTQGVVLLNPHP